MSNIKVKDDKGVRIIRFNRPDKRNALTLDMYRQLTEYLIEGEADNAIKVFLICGESHCFTSGNDIRDFMSNGELGPSHPAVRFLFCLLELKKPMVAAVSGAAVGIGTTLLLHCDLVYADEGALFQLPFVNLALVPEAGASMLLPQLVGYQKAAELLLLGDPFDAHTAKQLGIINDFIAPNELFEYALAVSLKLASKPTSAVQLTKQLMKVNRNKLQHQMYLELEHFGSQLRSEEARERFQAFMNKAP
ncbi:MAG: enoyl-CoA hydratase [Shewanella sp.]|nr:enoyl-CoA hydratase [Shewanella sp.]MCF1429409.1 enoyl-CoA hydratase [Shewanella sp.]MCF1439166.1 enoyl-CoA hydratase [Shewanella sp.]MCF1456018.1 enoyl-CoA hydratase [Shewanella sp.]